MLVGLFGLLIVAPALRTYAPASLTNLYWLLLGVAMAAGAATFFAGTTERVIAGLVSVALASCGYLGTLHEVPQLLVGALIGFLFFCLWSIASSLRQVLIGPDVDLNRIAGAVCVFFLLGFAWSVLYLIVALTVPDAFGGMTATSVTDQLSQLTYFSFVTLTTLGYGDVLPLVPVAQSLAYLEAVIGQLYIAILIAGLVGAHLNQHPG